MAAASSIRGLCAYCGRLARMTKDHVIAKSKGGSNLLYVCQTCNADKANQWMKDWLKKLPKEAPQHRYVARLKGKVRMD